MCTATGVGGLSLRAVRKRFDEREVLAGVDLRVEAGQTVALVGPSGCGKSTLLRLVNGLLTPDEGEVRVAGDLVLPDTVHRLRLLMGYVIQEGGLFPHLTARQNVTLMAEELGLTSEFVGDRLEALCKLVRFSPTLLDRWPTSLSGGQRQRVSLMRALMLQPKYVLLDEPLGALDPIVRMELQLELKEVFRSVDATVLLVTHDMAEACFFAARVVLLNEGRVHFDGAPSELLASLDPLVVRLVQAHRNLDVAR